MWKTRAAAWEEKESLYFCVSSVLCHAHGHFCASRVSLHRLRPKRETVCSLTCTKQWFLFSTVTSMLLLTIRAGGFSHSSKIWCYYSVTSNCKSRDLRTNNRKIFLHYFTSISNDILWSYVYESYLTSEPVVLQLCQVDVHWSSMYLWEGKGEGMFIFFLLVSDFLCMSDQGLRKEGWIECLEFLTL